MLALLVVLLVYRALWCKFPVDKRRALLQETILALQPLLHCVISSLRRVLLSLVQLHSQA